MKNEPGKNGGAADGAESGLAEEHSFHGLAVSPGIAIGPAHVSDHFDQAVPEYRIERIAAEQRNAEWAVQTEIAEIGESFSSMRDAYLAARFDDIRIVGMRLIRNLAKRPFEALARLPEGT